MKELLSGHNHNNLLQSKVTVKSQTIYVLSMSQDHCYDYHHLNIVLTGSTSESGFVLTYKIPRGLFLIPVQVVLFVCPFLTKMECRIHKNDYVRVPMH